MGRKTSKRKAAAGSTDDSPPVKKPAAKPPAKTKTVPKKISNVAVPPTATKTTPLAVAAPAPAPTPTVTTNPASPDDLTLLFSDEVKNIFQNLTAKTRGGKKLSLPDFSGLTVKNLKNALKLNDRPIGGNRKEVTKNVMDYITNGCPPRCPSCGGGRLRFSSKNGKVQYWCPGYMDDSDFVACNFLAAKDDITRNPWKNP